MDSARKLNQLVTDTEELLAEIDDERSPEIEKLRQRLTASIQKTKSLLETERGNGNGHVKVRHVAASVNDYVRDYPWVALATGILLASTVGILATSATRRSLDQ
jgi:ElaB/YqjD/DUF883 family membrane-anchored ribosome-binding protein